MCIKYDCPSIIVAYFTTIILWCECQIMDSQTRRNNRAIKAVCNTTKACVRIASNLSEASALHLLTNCQLSYGMERKTNLHKASIGAHAHAHWIKIKTNRCIYIAAFFRFINVIIPFICSLIGRMSTNLIIALTIAVAVIANSRIVVARSAPMLPAEMLKDLESDAVSNRMVILHANS